MNDERQKEHQEIEPEFTSDWIKDYLTSQWRQMSADDRRNCWHRMNHELHRVFGPDITFYTPPLSVSIVWLRELMEELGELPKEEHQ